MQFENFRQEPFVSIVLCTYNGQDFIEEQIDSLCAQTYRFMEIIISDDRSVDNTYKLLQAFAIKDGRIKLFRNEVNEGYKRNFSIACSKASGAFIAFCDQDDIWHPEKIEKMIGNWIPGTNLLYCSSVRFTGSDIPVNPVPNKRYRRFEGTDTRKISIFNTISGHAILARKDFVDALLPFPENLMYDWWMGAFASSNGGVRYLPETLVYQRVHGLNASVGKGFAHNEKEYKHVFNVMVLNHLDAFKNINNMLPAHQLFYNTLSMHWRRSLQKKFDWDLFLFLLRHRKIIFWYKKKKIALFSHIKHSFILARNYI